MRRPIFALLVLLAVASAALGQTADLRVQITDNPDPATIEGPINYTVTATNSGPDAAPNAVLTIEYTADATFGGISAAAGWNCTAPVPPSRVTTCTIGSFPVGTANFTLSIFAPEEPGAAGVTATIASAAADPNPGNQTDTETTTVRTRPSIIFAKSVASGGQTAGSNVAFSITATNNGPTANNAPALAQVIDTLPPSLTLVSATATSGTAVADIPNNRVTWNGSIAVAQTVTITITAFVKASAANTPINNAATYSYDANGDGTLDATGVAATSFTPAAAPGAIPTLSTYALMALALVLAAIAVTRL